MNRIRELRIRAKLTQVEFSRLMNISQASLSGYETGRYEPDNKTLMRIAEFFGATTDYILGLNNDAPPEQMPANLSGISERLTNRVPLFGAIAAGAPIYADGEVRDYVDAPCEADYALTIKGDSMFPDYQDGDIVYILQRDDVPNGAVAVVLIDDEATLKRVYKKKGGAALVSINPKYAPINVENEFGGVRIIGIPCGYTRMFKEE